MSKQKKKSLVTFITREYNIVIYNDSSKISDWTNKEKHSQNEKNRHTDFIRNKCDLRIIELILYSLYKQKYSLKVSCLRGTHEN